MRHSNRHVRGSGPSTLAAALVALVTALAVVACGSSAAPSAAPSALPTPVPTPDPHLSEPVTANQIYGVLAAAKLGMSCPTASLGDQPGVVKEINCSVAGWPLLIVQYQSSDALNRDLGWAGSTPGAKEPPYGWAALNVAIQYGPIGLNQPVQPDSARAAMAAQIVGILDPLLWPLRQHSIQMIPARTPVPVATPIPTPPPSKAPVASAKPAKSPKPSHAP